MQRQLAFAAASVVFVVFVYLSYPYTGFTAIFLAPMLVLRVVQGMFSGNVDFTTSDTLGDLWPLMIYYYAAMALGHHAWVRRGPRWVIPAVAFAILPTLLGLTMLYGAFFFLGGH